MKIYKLYGVYRYPHASDYTALVFSGLVAAMVDRRLPMLPTMQFCSFLVW